MSKKFKKFKSGITITGDNLPATGEAGDIALKSGSKQLYTWNAKTSEWIKIQKDALFDNIEPANGFKVVYFDAFEDGTSELTSKVDNSNTKASYIPEMEGYRIVCDKSKTVTTTGTSYTISATPLFTLAVGDIIYHNATGQFRRIVSVSTPTTGTLDAAFSPNLSSAACMLSQAVWTKDLVNNTGSFYNKTRPRDLFPNTNILAINIDYFDSLALNDGIPNVADAARVVVSASNQGLQSDLNFPLSNTFTSIFTRPAAPNQINDYPLLDNTNKQRLHLVFFCNPNDSNIAVNLLGYRVSFYSEDLTLNGGLLNSAFCMSDGSGIEINCDPPYLVAGKTRVKLHWNFIPSLNSGKTSGDLEVMVDGLVLPRFVSGATLDDYYIEVPGTTDTIEFSSDLSATPLSIEIRRRQGVIDASTENTTKIDQLVSYEFISSATTISIFNKIKKIVTNSTGGPFTITLPANPEIGDTVYFYDGQEIWATNNVTVNRNGKNINGLASNLILDVDGGSVKLIYVDATQGWRVYP